jgi:hypothetical protein
VAPDHHGTVWMAVNGKDGSYGEVLGYRPGTNTIFTLTHEKHGVPAAAIIDDMAFTPDGYLVVYAAGKLARGRVFVPIQPGAPSPSDRPFLWLAASLALLALAIAGSTFFGILRHPTVVAVRARPQLLYELPLPAVAAPVRRLRRARALTDIFQHLGLPVHRARMVQRSAARRRFEPHDLTELAALLGMSNSSPGSVQTLAPGLMALPLRLPDPEPLRGHTVALFALQLDAVTGTPAELRRAMEDAMQRMDQLPEHPYLLLCSATEAPGDLLPASHDGLLLAEPELKTLLLSRSPIDALAGYLVTRKLVALSPYSSAGEVKDERMFFGRTRLLRELVQAPSLQHIIVGPRRVGKSSLLKRLAKVLSERRPALGVTFLDLLGVDSPATAATKLAGALGAQLSESADADTLFVEVLRRQREQDGRVRVVLIDEFDALAHADAARGHPFLSVLRSLQASGGCSFVITGFDYLHRETLDQRSPLYNFATVTELGPLEPEAARELAAAPMARLGIHYATDDLPAHIAEVTGGYPSLVQQLCDALLRTLSTSHLVITAESIAATERSDAVHGYLDDLVRQNTLHRPIVRIVALELCRQDTFTLAQVADLLQRIAAAAVPLHVIEEILRLLRLAGFVAAHDDVYRWAIPLLRDALQATDPLVKDSLLAELDRNPATWLRAPGASVTETQESARK